MSVPAAGVTPRGLLLALTFVTGVVDAVGYLRLDQVFAGNVTGNVVVLEMAADSRLGAARGQERCAGARRWR